MEFCPECHIGLSNAQIAVGYCNNCHCDFEEYLSKEKKEWDGVCRCGHKHSEHGKSSSINYTAGRCGVSGCNCKHFLMPNPQPQSSPIGVEQAAKDYARSVLSDIENPHEDEIYIREKAFIAGSQWASSPKCTKDPNTCQVAFCNWNKCLSEPPAHPTAEFCEGEDDIAFDFHKANDHPTAVNGDDEIALLNEIIKKQHELILSGERRGYEKAKQEFQPKAAAPKADEWSKEEILNEFLQEPYPEDIFPPLTSEQLKEAHEVLKTYCNFPLDRLSAHIGRILRKPLVEFANQFKSQPQETK